MDVSDLNAFTRTDFSFLDKPMRRGSKWTETAKLAGKNFGGYLYNPWSFRKNIPMQFPGVLAGYKKAGILESKYRFKEYVQAVDGSDVVFIPYDYVAGLKGLGKYDDLDDSTLAKILDERSRTTDKVIKKTSSVAVAYALYSRFRDRAIEVLYSKRDLVEKYPNDCRSISRLIGLLIKYHESEQYDERTLKHYLACRTGVLVLDDRLVLVRKYKPDVSKASRTMTLCGIDEETEKEYYSFFSPATLGGPLAKYGSRSGNVFLCFVKAGIYYSYKNNLVTGNKPELFESCRDIDNWRLEALYTELKYLERLMDDDRLSDVGLSAARPKGAPETAEIVSERVPETAKLWSERVPETADGWEGGTLYRGTKTKWTETAALVGKEFGGYLYNPWSFRKNIPMQFPEVLAGYKKAGILESKDSFNEFLDAVEGEEDTYVPYNSLQAPFGMNPDGTLSLSGIKEAIEEMQSLESVLDCRESASGVTRITEVTNKKVFKIYGALVAYTYLVDYKEDAMKAFEDEYGDLAKTDKLVYGTVARAINCILTHYTDVDTSCFRPWLLRLYKFIPTYDRIILVRKYQVPLNSVLAKMNRCGIDEETRKEYFSFISKKSPYDSEIDGNFAEYVSDDSAIECFMKAGIYYSYKNNLVTGERPSVFDRVEGIVNWDRDKLYNELKYLGDLLDVDRLDKVGLARPSTSTYDC